MSRNVSPQKKQMMLEENIKTLIPKMAVPTIIAQMITTIYNLVDTYFVSTLGTNATAAVGVNSSLERMITIIGSLIVGRVLSEKYLPDLNFNSIMFYMAKVKRASYFRRSVGE